MDKIKKVLIVGKNSYIGKSLEAYLNSMPNLYAVESISVRDEAWKNIDFSCYEVVIFCAGLVHKKECLYTEADYFNVNTNLSVAVASKAKEAGVAQFIYLSTMAVYGIEGKLRKVKNIKLFEPNDTDVQKLNAVNSMGGVDILNKEIIIDRHTNTMPNTYYGKSKLAAEKELLRLRNGFLVCILRPPMVYGHEAPGNYTRLEKFVLKFKIFPSIKNQRSMVHIDHLCAYIEKCMSLMKSGIFHPQDTHYTCTLEMAKEIANCHSIELKIIPFLNPFIRIIAHFSKSINKVWGDLVYDKELE